jgi:hypothetical protein
MSAVEKNRGSRCARCASADPQSAGNPLGRVSGARGGLLRGRSFLLNSRKPLRSRPRGRYLGLKTEKEPVHLGNVGLSVRGKVRKTGRGPLSDLNRHRRRTASWPLVRRPNLAVRVPDGTPAGGWDAPRRIENAKAHALRCSLTREGSFTVWIAASIRDSLTGGRLRRHSVCRSARRVRCQSHQPADCYLKLAFSPVRGRVRHITRR